MQRFRFGRFFLYLFILFFLCFWFSGGNTILNFFDPALKTTIKQALDANQISSLTNVTNETKNDLTSTYDRIYRLIALKSAVDSKIAKQNYVKLENISLSLQQAIIATEDNRFYTHPGFDVEGIMRASLVNLQYGEVTEGGSTITQQLVKNLFLSQDRSLNRKMEEFALAVDMEMRYSKEEILELYLNTIYFGSGFYGISEASMGYFAKMPNELTLAEAAMLAGLPNAPSVYSPYVDFNAAKKRQSVVLSRMADTGYITPTIANETKSVPIYLAE